MSADIGNVGDPSLVRQRDRELLTQPIEGRTGRLARFVVGALIALPRLEVCLTHEARDPLYTTPCACFTQITMNTRTTVDTMTLLKGSLDVD